MAIVANDRIDVRISREQKELIKHASELSGFKSLSEFIVFCVQSEAKKIIHDDRSFLTTMNDKKKFLEAIMNPPAPNAALKKAQLNYLKFMEANGTANSEPRKKT